MASAHTRITIPPRNRRDTILLSFAEPHVRGVRRRCRLHARGSAAAAAAAGVAAAVVLPFAAAAQTAAPLTVPEGVPPAFAIHPRIELDEIFTDNASGGVPGSASSTTTSTSATAAGQVPSASGSANGTDFITRIAPGVGISEQGARQKLFADYTAIFDKYARNDNLDKFSNRLFAFGNLEAIQEQLFIDATASVSQELIDQRGPVTGSDRLLSSNETTVSTYHVSPYLRLPIGNFADTELRYGFGQSYSGALATGTRNEFSAGINSGPDFSRFNWTGVLSDYETDSGTDQQGGVGGNTSRRLAQVTGKYAIDRVWAPTASVGYEQIRNGTLGSQPDGPIGSVGVEITPGPRSKLVLAANHRYDRNYVSGSGSYEITPNLNALASYSEGIQTTQDQLINNTSTLGVDDYGNFVDTRTDLPYSPRNSLFGLNNGLGNLAYRDKIGTASLHGFDDRNTYDARFTYEQRSSSSSVISSTQESYGVLASFGRSLNPDLRAILTLQYINTDYGSPDNRNDDLYRGSGSLSYALSETLHATVTYTYLARLSNAPGAAVRENTVILGLRKDF